MHRLAALGGLIGSIFFIIPGTGQTPTDLDEQVLLAAKLPADNAGLLDFLRRRSARPDDVGVVKKLVEQLGSGAFKERDQASRQLLMRGPIALLALNAALKHGSLEVVRRADDLIKSIEAIGPEVPVAAARVLTSRQARGAAEVLLGYLPSAQDEWVEDEVLACLGRLTIQQGKVDGSVVRALHGADPAERAAAVYVLGRRAGIDHREVVRSLLADADPQVRLRAGLGLMGKRLPQMIRDSAHQDEEVLKKHLGAVDEASLLAFLRKRTLTDADQARLRRLITDLGHAKFKVRDEASRLLIAEGTPALALLKTAESSPDAEVVRRARLCGDQIRNGPGPALPIAVVHRLAQPAEEARSPAAAIAALLGYVPFADDESVEDEVLAALTILSAAKCPSIPCCVAALSDPWRPGAGPRRWCWVASAARIICRPCGSCSTIPPSRSAGAPPRVCSRPRTRSPYPGSSASWATPPCLACCRWRSNCSDWRGNRRRAWLSATVHSPRAGEPSRRGTSGGLPRRAAWT